MTRRLILNNILIIPFGRPKWHIKQINITAVSTEKTTIESPIPFAFINKSHKIPLQIADFWQSVPDDFSDEVKQAEPLEKLQFIKDYLKKSCEIQTPYELKFIDYYFDKIEKYSILKAGFILVMNGMSTHSMLLELFGFLCFFPYLKLICI